MVRQDATFDTEELYTTRWRTPHHQHLDRSRPHHVLNQTRAGRIVLAELSARGIGPADVSIEVALASIILGAPTGMGVREIVLPLEGEIDRDRLLSIRRLLNAARANLIREWMMAAAGWRPGDPEPAWSLLTTPLAEIAFHGSGYDSFAVWSLRSRLFDGFRGIDGTDVETGDARDAIPDGFRVEKHGPLLKIEGTLAEGVAFAQTDRTRLAMRTNSPTLHPMVFNGQRAAGYGFNAEGPVGDYLRTRHVRSARRNPSNPHGSIVLELAVPVITMAEIPAAALAAIGLDASPTGMRRYPLWTVPRKLPAQAFAPTN